jgi:hypothetical protein
VSDVVHLLYSLAYFDEADRESMPRMLWQVDWRQVKTKLKQSLRRVTGKDDPGS